MNRKENTEKEPKVTVIIPIYNVENYLSDCLQSVVTQTLKEIEVICINDKSSDFSYEILERFACKDSRIIVIQNDRNRGLSYSRNVGLKRGKGKYIFYLDSDDMIVPTALERLYELAEEKKVEGVFFSYCEKRGEDILLRQRSGLYKKIYTGMELLQLFESNDDLIYGAQLQFWKRDYLSRNNLYFYERILHEDVLYTYRTLVNAKNVLCIEDALYVLRIRNDSITTTPVTWKHFEGFFISLCEIFKDWVCDINNKSKLEIKLAYWEAIFFRVLDRNRTLRDQIFPESLEEGDELANELYNIFLKLKREYNGVEKILTDRLLEKVRGFDKVIVYGAGKIGRKIVLELGEAGVDNIIVAVTHKEDKEYLIGAKIYEISSLNLASEENLIIIAAGKKVAKDMKAMAIELGYSNILEL